MARQTKKSETRQLLDELPLRAAAHERVTLRPYGLAAVDVLVDGKVFRSDVDKNDAVAVWGDAVAAQLLGCGL